MSFAGCIELLVVAALAFVIIGPKDLPKVLFTLGRFVHAMRKMAGGFWHEFEHIHHFSEVEEMNAKRKKDDAKTSS